LLYRVKLEQTYSDNLSKLAIRARKATGDTLGTMRKAWEGFATQLDGEAQIRKALANDILEQIVKPFKTFIEGQKEARKQVEVAVEKASKAYSDKKSDLLKTKKSAFKEAKESEGLTVQLEATRGKTSAEKELSKLDAKCKKAEELVMKADKDHIRKVIETERSRLALESSMAYSSNTLQMQEEERIGYVKNMLKAFGEFMRDCVPKTIECLDNLNDNIEKIDVDSDINELIRTRGSEKLPGEQIAFTCYEADASSIIDEKRRKLALEQKYKHLKNALKSEKQARAGLSKLASVYQETPKFGGASTVDDVSVQIAHANAVIDCLEASLFHISNTMPQSGDFQQSRHRLSDCIQVARDKQNLPLVILKVPFDRVVVGIPEELDEQDIASSQIVQHEFDSDEFEDIEDGQKPSNVQEISDTYSHGGGQCRAIYDYAPAREDELSVRAGDVISIIEKSEGGWWTGQLNGLTGLFPANYVEEI